ncbi:hypothetical protein SAMN05660463_00126 [Pseudomonas sp. URIL14HWK12:I9]|nr:hypothetical protein F474_01278 [Pseudomonas sp. URIL14HWK12:I12]PVZ27743.1 hypothetical protein F470_00933 [Pseudomonas sp. URIL14HWK12:I10]PVZ38632.1 hypothetical protein F472_01278 [Pseudomonas sp. URIL14HWK12:I11]SNZ02584.1 hypothetical protein SAMN05660463_00126 [Pseudomonas sp. URIL14HWK12:I9]
MTLMIDTAAAAARGYIALLGDGRPAPNWEEHCDEP